MPLAAGILTVRARSLGPASSSSTEWDSERRFASTQPAEPPPTMM